VLNIRDLDTIPKEYYVTCNNISLKEGDILLTMDGKRIRLRAVLLKKKNTIE